jgi:GT2 family glycosyltransferase
MSNLTWGLVVATKDRLEPLKICVALALGQTRAPAEVVIVDSSADWDVHRDHIKTLVDAHPDVRLVYEKGAAPSLTVQRNQAIAAATADIAFMIDDDSFLYPDAAAEIMRIYEADSDGRVVGVQADESKTSPQAASGTTEARRQEKAFAGIRRASPLLRRVLRTVLMASKTEVFVPYDKTYPAWTLPDTVAALPVRPEVMFGGFRMTYRRDVVSREPFDKTLRYYCPGEDLDGSYRIARHGALVTSIQGKVFHFSSAAGRMNRTQVAHLWSLNQAVLLRRHAPDQAWAKGAYRRKMTRRVLTDCVKDLIMRRFRFPQTRGSWRAWREARAVFEMTPETLESWYPDRQERLIKGLS